MTRIRRAARTSNALLGVDPLSQFLRRFEPQYPTRWDWRGRSGFWIAPNSQFLVAYEKRAKRSKLNIFAAFQAIGNFSEDLSDQGRCCRARQPDIPANRRDQIGARNGLAVHPRARMRWNAAHVTITAQTVRNAPCSSALHVQSSPGGSIKPLQCRGRSNADADRLRGFLIPIA